MKKIDHIAIAVPDLDAAEQAYKEVMGLEFHEREEVKGQKVLASIFHIGESRIELISPTEEDSPIAGFIAKKGGGLHHICFEVDDIEAEMRALTERGARLLNETPAAGVGGSKVAFLHPKSAAGVLIEIVQKKG